jgi:two-component system, cell cycle sensor histidine kinase and response regulator CckA
MQPQVLFVSDDADLRAVATRVLEREGYRIQAASHSGHALLAARESRFDVLVAELSTPDMSGPALAERLRRDNPALQAVFMANPGTPEGLENVVVRPFTRDDLVARIESALHAGVRV